MNNGYKRIRPFGKMRTLSVLFFTALSVFINGCGGDEPMREESGADSLVVDIFISSDVSLDSVGAEKEDVVIQDGSEDIMQEVYEDDASENDIADAAEDLSRDASVSDTDSDTGVDVAQDTGSQAGCENVASHIVISEIATRGETDSDEFVELYNPLNGDIDLSGWRLQHKGPTGVVWNDRLIFPEKTKINAHHFLLLAIDSPDYSGPEPDLRYSSLGMSDDGHIRIIDRNGVEIDKIGFNQTDPEKNASPVACTSSPCKKSVERKAGAKSSAQSMGTGGADEKLGNGYDTNNNLNDFYIRENREPQNSLSMPEDHGCFDCKPEGQEICDGKDNDCNGLTDTDDPYLLLECELQKGVCSGARHTPEQCVNGKWIRVCNATEYKENFSVTELCDGLDNDCNGQTDENFPDLGTECTMGKGECQRNGVYVCGSNKDTVICNASPGEPAEEVCNGKDDNCDGFTDEEGASGCKNYYADNDSDGYGQSNDYRCLCASEGKYKATKGGDCNDLDETVNPDATESCNGKDDNCDGYTDEESAQGCKKYYIDEDADGYGMGADFFCLCLPSGKYTATISGDCNDFDKTINPGASESCNGKDDNCDGYTDEENALGCKNYYADNDGDGYGVSDDYKCLCMAGGKYKATKGGDCNDLDKTINPAATEVCNGRDDNCNGSTDEGCP